MTALTLTIPEDVMAQAKEIGIDNEISLINALKTFIQIQKTSQSNQRQLGRLKSSVLYMADDFNEPLEDFQDCNTQVLL